jgi:RNA polymerase sigma factor (sigma-70 family)
MIRPSARAALPTPGDSEAAGFCAWIEPHWRTMRRVAWRLAASGESEDVLQNALLAAWRYRHRFDPSRGTAAAWLTSITVNEARRSHRGRHHWLLVPLTDTIDEPEHPPSVDLQRAIARLPPRQALAVHLHYYADLSLRDTAAAMDCARRAP